ncbi:MAG: (2Fe-2S)-binding protein [Deltaproteobacteria bacterium]|nr:(2Fe-2S)-binding protein [Deltaproteobacteria bacterium]
MTAKTLVCWCEDVTEIEIREAIRGGCRDLESLKRFLAVGTGACQAKGCVAAMVRLLEEETGTSFVGSAPFVSRPPTSMTTLADFAGRDASERVDG